MSKWRTWWATINKTRDEGVIKSERLRVQYEQNVEYFQVIEIGALEELRDELADVNEVAREWKQYAEKFSRQRDEAFIENARLQGPLLKDREDDGKRIEELRAENERLRIALKHLADINWHDDNAPEMNFREYARYILESIKDKK